MEDPAYILEVLVAALVLAPAVDLASQDRYRQLSKEVEKYYGEKASYIQESKIIKARLSVNEKLTTENTEEASSDHTSLAWCYHYMGKYKEALEAGETSRAINPLNTEALSVIAATYEQQGLYDQAIHMHKLCLHNKRTLRELPPDHPEIGASLNNLGNCYRKKDQHGLAIEMYEEALHIWTKNHRSRLILNSIYDITDKIVKTLPGNLKAIKPGEEELPFQIRSDQKIIAGMLENMGNAYYEIGEHVLASKILEKSLHMRKETYYDQPDHPDIANLYNTIGLNHCNNGKYDRGTPLIEKSLRLLKSQYKEQPYHPMLAGVLHSLAVCYLGQGHILQAEQRLEESLKIYREVFPGGHDNIDEVQKRLVTTRSKKVQEKEEVGKKEL